MSESIVFTETVARKNFPRGVPDGVDPESRFYTCDAVLHGRERDWDGILAVPEFVSDELTFTHFYLADGFRERGPEIFASDGRTAKYRSGLKEGIMEKLNMKAVIR